MDMYNKKKAFINTISGGEKIKNPDYYLNYVTQNINNAKEYMDNYSMKGSNVLGKFSGLGNSISYNADENMKVKGDIRAHELSHAKSPGFNTFSDMQELFIKETLKDRNRPIPKEINKTIEEKKYAKDPTEISAFIDQARYILNLDPEKTYTEEEYNEMLKDERLPRWLKMWNAKEFKKLNEGLVEEINKITFPEDFNQKLELNESEKQNLV